MQNLLGLNLFSSSIGNNTIANNSTPATLGKSLFRNLLNSVTDESQDNILGPSLFQGTGAKGKRPFSYNLLSQKDNAGSLDNLIQDLGFTSSQFILPSSSVTKLISFLEDLGLQDREIDQLITDCSSQEGNLRMDKLLPQILEIMQTQGTGKDSMVVESKDIPRVQEAFYKTGLGSQDVKEVIEKATDPKGDIRINRLSNALTMVFNKPVSEDELTSLLERYEIQTKPSILDQNSKHTELNRELLNFSSAESSDMQNLAKQKIAAILTDKGIPPQEIKSFLETLDVGYSTSLVKDKAQLDSDLNNILDQVTVKTAQDLGKKEWNTKIHEGLKDPVISKDNETRASLLNQPKEGEQRPNIDLMNQVPEIKDRLSGPHSEPTVNRGDNPKDGPNLKDILGAHINMLKTENNQTRINLSPQSENSNNLPEPLPKIMDHMSWMIRAGEQKGHITLHPPELGRMDLDLTVKQGHLQANLNTDSYVVKEIIEANLNQLKQQLTEQGFTVDKFEVMIGLNDRDSKEGEMWTSNRKKRPPSSKGSGTGDDTLDIGTSHRDLTVYGVNQIDVHV